MSEAMSGPELTNPGSLTDYLRERSHPAVLTDEVALRREWEDKLTRYRLGLAALKGIAPEDLHYGRLPADAQAEADSNIAH